MGNGFINPANDGIDVTDYPYDIEAEHGRYAKHAYVVETLKGTRVQVITTAGNTRTYTITNRMEEIPGFIKSFTALTNVSRIRIFWDHR